MISVAVLHGCFFPSTVRAEAPDSSSGSASPYTFPDDTHYRIWVAGIDIGDPEFTRGMDAYPESKRKLLLLVLHAGTKNILESASTGLECESRRNIEMIEPLLAKDPALAKATYPDGTPVLKIAVENNVPELAKILLQNGADPTLGNVDDEGVAFFAEVMLRGRAMTEAFLDGWVDPNDDTSCKAKIWLPGGLPIHDAAMLGQDDVMKLFLDRGADPSLRDADNNLALFYAIVGPSNQRNQSGGNWLRICELLIEQYKKLNSVEKGDCIQEAIGSLESCQQAYQKAKTIYQNVNDSSWRKAYPFYVQERLLDQSKAILLLVLKSTEGEVRFRLSPYARADSAYVERLEKLMQKFSIDYVIEDR